MSVNPLGIGFVVLLGTIIGMLVYYPAEHLLLYVVIGLIHGIFATTASWVAFSAVRFFNEASGPHGRV